MDQNKCAQGRENLLDSKPDKLLHVAEKSSALDSSPKKYEFFGNQDSETKFAFQTPEKTNLPLNTKSEDIELEILQRHKTILELFDSMSCSLRLLGLRKKPPTFENIRAQVEVLTRRKFSHGHVAQLKYLLPEAIQIDKILVHDKKTVCMKPDMKITLLFDVIDDHKEHSKFIALHQLFASRLVNFFTSHPEACDIPETMLGDPFKQSKESAYKDRDSDTPVFIFPEPHNQVSQTIYSEQLLSHASLEDQPTTTETVCLSKLSHMCPSFSRHFSEKVLSEREKIQLLASAVPLSFRESYNLRNQNSKTEQAGESYGLSLKIDKGINQDTKYEPEKDILPTLPVCPRVSVNINSYDSPSSKHVSGDCTVVQTPAQSTPKRLVPMVDVNHNGTTGQKQASSSKAAKRSLDFSFLEGDESECDEILPCNSQFLDASSAILEKVEEGLDGAAERQRISQSNVVHQQSSMDLPGLVSVIHHIFQSNSYSPITKEELVHKIIISDFDFVERSRVEEQIDILEKLVPDWICRKLAPTGDAFYSIKKMSDLKSLKSRLACTCTIKFPIRYI